MSPAMHTTDIVIAGAGSAGCALAARLSENPALNVTLIEAGSEARNRWIDIPIGYFKTVGDPRFDWRFETEADPAMADRRLPWPRGKGLGGTSLINGMLYLRGHRRDYDRWAAKGNAGWDWESVLPLFMRSQHRVHADGATHGKGGPLAVSNLPRDPLSDAFIAAAGRCGIPATPDFNTGDNTGAGYFQMTTRDGVRQSTARAFLDPVRQRPNLRVLTGLQVTRVRFEGRRAVGIDATDAANRTVAIDARREVVLCAGAVQSPQLLMLSGIGDAAQLQAHGIAVVHHLRGVGLNLQDHLQVRPSFQCHGVETLNDVANSTWRSAREFLRYHLTRGGALNAGVYRAGAFFALDAQEPDWPDIQIHFGLVSFDRPHQPPHPFPGITLSACLLRPFSRGRIDLASSDPRAAPRIHPGYLEDPRDQRLAVAAVRKMREIAAQAPLANVVARAHEPDASLQRDDEILDWVRRRSGSIFHPVGTCAMGPAGDADAVVDSQLRVHGLSGVRVVDGSAMPDIVSGNTNAPIIMMAERAADWIRMDAA
jgi:choline dehydrogenase